MITNEDYEALVSDYLKKQIVMLGPEVALSKARCIEGLTVDDNGTVSGISGDAQSVMRQVELEFEVLLGSIAKRTMAELLEKYPAFKSEARNTKSETNSNVLNSKV